MFYESAGSRAKVAHEKATGRNLPMIKLIIFPLDLVAPIEWYLCLINSNFKIKLVVSNNMIFVDRQ